jgi:hypothetical protein
VLLNRILQSSINSDYAEEKTNAGENDITDYRQFIQDYIDKLYVKIQNGDTEPTFQIGNQSFTINEWNEFLENFDSAEDAIKELVEEEIEFTDEAQYEKATTFMDWAKDHMDNFLFSAHQNFWEDYLNGDMDVEAFQETIQF